MAHVSAMNYPKRNFMYKEFESTNLKGKTKQKRKIRW
jgi:hypothetical protein